MPGTYRAPGVYVEELPSSVRPVVGVSTSTAAFIDVFTRGPANVAVKISGPGDFDRVFGGICSFSEASYGISQFFLNGGSAAWVVRVLAKNSAKAIGALPQSATSGAVSGSPSGAVSGTSGAVGGEFPVFAKSEGAWGNSLMVGVQHPSPRAGELVATFDVVVAERIADTDKVVVREVFRALDSDVHSRRYYVDVVARGSSLIELGPVAGGRPAETWGAPARDDLARSHDRRDFRPLTRGDDGDLPGEDTFDAADFGTRLIGSPAESSGTWALDTIAPDIFNILCIPAMALLGADARTSLLTAAAEFCLDRRAMLLVDPPADHDDAANTSKLSELMSTYVEELDPHPNAAAYFPRLVIPDPAGGDRVVGPSGTVAGVYARTDTERGVWKAPAGTDSTLRGAIAKLTMTDAVSEKFNPIGVNVLRTFPVYRDVIWGARTLEGADLKASQWKYVPVRRTALFIEESLRQGLQWVVFEPNDEPLWSQIRLNVGAFMQRLFRLGAFAGQTPNEAYLVKCDSDTTTADDISLGVVNILVGFQPLFPAEFVVIKIQQLTRPPEV